ncbi:MAG: ABC transporter ATP-binding protein/permease [Oligoflexia bacterium]|nr:ABC transporter ATP-binding protein/permease [Oligoflexia bacterium]
MSTLNDVKRIIRDAQRLVALTWREKRNLLVGIVLATLCTSTLPFVQSYTIGRLLNALVSSSQADRHEVVYTLLSLAVLAGSCYAVANMLQFFLKTVLYKELFHVLTVIILRTTASLDIASHENPERRDLLTKVEENAMWRAPEFMQRLTYLLQNLAEVSIAAVIFLSADKRIGAMIIAAALPRLLLDLSYNNKLWQVETGAAETRRKFWHARWFLVAIEALPEIKLFQNVPFFVGRVDEHLGTIKRRELAVERVNAIGQLLILLVSESVAAFALYAFVRRTLEGTLDVGGLAFLIASCGTFRSSLQSLSQNVGSQFRDGKFVRDMFEAFDLKPLLPTTHSSGRRLAGQIEEIRFDGVWFAYPGTQRWILKDFNLCIKGGSTVGIVAENGSGKSTLAKLLCRMYDPTRGRILVNGVDIREFDLDYWQSKLGVVKQDFLHYQHLDVESAIRLGRVGSCPDNIEAVHFAAQAAEAHAFIEGLPQGYGTTLGSSFKGGVELSGGQYQRLALARVFFRQPEIAILDEPTSAVDSDAEARIYQKILSSLPGCIKIVISHRYYTLRKADRICLLQNGSIVEYGDHEELMRLGGLYAERYTAQAAEYH